MPTKRDSAIAVALIGAVASVVVTWLTTRHTQPESPPSRGDSVSLASALSAYPLAGRILDDSTKQPIVGARVTIDLDSVSVPRLSETGGVFAASVPIKSSNHLATILAAAEKYDKGEFPIVLKQEGVVIDVPLHRSGGVSPQGTPVPPTTRTKTAVSQNAAAAPDTKCEQLLQQEVRTSTRPMTQISKSGSASRVLGRSVSAVAVSAWRNCRDSAVSTRSAAPAR
ncbi:MAG TPA: hypothetical protein VJN70_13940 [Gemmatimonadaceae bacterium]|nr:hypothetical protein [Gemmatimonadaceae bacterium]